MAFANFPSELDFIAAFGCEVTHDPMFDTQFTCLFYNNIEITLDWMLNDFSIRASGENTADIFLDGISSISILPNETGIALAGRNITAKIILHPTLQISMARLSGTGT